MSTWNDELILLGVFLKIKECYVNSNWECEYGRLKDVDKFNTITLTSTEFRLTVTCHRMMLTCAQLYVDFGEGPNGVVLKDNMNASDPNLMQYIFDILKKP